mmetsp:Transcript_305/g.1035  ORF Transcript_305/g.1035 Transcript_305/m.1035 type:complete len:90 (+) Transcript_305:955-1224(+)
MSRQTNIGGRRLENFGGCAGGRLLTVLVVVVSCALRLMASSPTLPKDEALDGLEVLEKLGWHPEAVRLELMQSEAGAEAGLARQLVGDT